MSASSDDDYLEVGSQVTSCSLQLLEFIIVIQFTCIKWCMNTILWLQRTPVVMFTPCMSSPTSTWAAGSRLLNNAPSAGGRATEASISTCLQEHLQSAVVKTHAPAWICDLRSLLFTFQLSSPLLQRNHMIISTDAHKRLTKNSTSIHDKRFLVVQWLRACLANGGDSTSIIQEDPICHGQLSLCAITTEAPNLEPKLHVTREAAVMRSPCITTKK